MKILLADDDTRVLTIIKLWLERYNYSVTTVSNGKLALEHLNENEYDILISDVNMPLMKGYDLVKNALELPSPPALIVLLTSRCDTKELAEQINSDRVRIFNKPFSPVKLTELINNLQTNKSSQAK